MIKIVDFPTVDIEYDELTRGGGINDLAAAAEKNAGELCFLIKRNHKVVAAASLAEIRENRIRYKTFTISEDLFIIVRDYVHENQVPEGINFPVLDEKGLFLFLVGYVKNIEIESKPNDFLDYEKRFLMKKNLDFSLLDQYHTIIFVETEEYSVALAKMLQNFCPDKRCLFLDRYARLFVKGKSVRTLPFQKIAGRMMAILKSWIQGRRLGFMQRVLCLFLYKWIKSLEKRNRLCIVVPDNDYYSYPIDIIFQSTKMMYSLLWCRDQKTYGNKNADKTIVILNYSCLKEGLVSIIRSTYLHVKWILEKGYIPVIDLHTFPNQYLNTAEDNMWEYFFEPVSDISLQEVYESKNVISATDNDIVLVEEKINPYQEKWWKLPLDGGDFHKIVRLNEKTKQYIKEKMPKMLSGRVLGVVMRGTDYRKEAAEQRDKEWRKNIVDADTFLQACVYYKDRLGCEKIFLATEDAEYFEMFRQFFGDSLLSVEQERVNYDYQKNPYKQVSDLMNKKDGKTAGRDYLAVIESLAKCNALIYNISCGAVLLAECWNDKKYEVCKNIKPDWAPH